MFKLIITLNYPTHDQLYFDKSFLLRIEIRNLHRKNKKETVSLAMWVTVFDVQFIS